MKLKGIKTILPFILLTAGLALGQTTLAAIDGQATYNIACTGCPGNGGSIPSGSRAIALAPATFFGPSGTNPGFEQPDGAVLMGRDSSDSITNSVANATGQIRATLSLQTNYRGAWGTSTGLISVQRIYGNTANDGSPSIYGVTFADQASTAGYIGVHGECHGMGTGVCIGLNAEGGGAGTSYGVVSNQGSGDVLYTVTSATWSGGIATLTLDCNPSLYPGCPSTHYHAFVVGENVKVTGVGLAGYDVNPGVITAIGPTSLTATTISYAVSNPGGSSSGGTAEVPTLYVGESIQMWHSHVNAGGFGIGIDASRGEHPVAIKVTESSGTFDQYLTITAGHSTMESISLYQTQSGTLQAPNAVGFYRVTSKIASISADIEDTLYQYGSLSLNAASAGTMTTIGIIDGSGFTVTGKGQFSGALYGNSLTMDRSGSTVVQQIQWTVGGSSAAIGSYLFGSDINGNLGLSAGTGSSASEVAWFDNGGAAAIYRLEGQTNTQSANDTLYLCRSVQTNCFFDRDHVGGQVIWGYNTPRASGAANTFTIYDNATDRNTLFQATSKGSKSGSSQIVLMPGGSGALVGIGAAPVSFALEVTGTIKATASLQTPGNVAAASYTANGHTGLTTVTTSTHGGGSCVMTFNSGILYSTAGC